MFNGSPEAGHATVGSIPEGPEERSLGEGMPQEDWGADNNHKTLSSGEEIHAARIIQRTWRRHVDVHIFKYLKRLLNSYNRGDPRQLLKYINPLEADLLDAASGAYVRFRLGSASFPPNIYYKIFTHRPIVDLCASSPKDYTVPAAKIPVPCQVHGHVPVAVDDESGWYHRVENNDWRPLSGEVYQFNAYRDPISLQASTNVVRFHQCRMQRHQEAERMKKRRKIEWLKKMYKMGALQARTKQPDMTVLVEGTARDLLSAVDQLGPDQVFEWEVDELLEWTNALNFEKYMMEWKDIATSRSSGFYTNKVED